MEDRPDRKEKLMKTKIDITREEINGGLAGKPHQCPTALAFTKVIKPEYQMFVGITSSHIRDKSNKCVFCVPNPKEVQEFIKKFDCNKESVSPMSFEVEIPEEYLVEPNKKNIDMTNLAWEEIQNLKKELRDKEKELFAKIEDGVYQHKLGAEVVKHKGKWYLLGDNIDYNYDEDYLSGKMSKL